MREGDTLISASVVGFARSTSTAQSRSCPFNSFLYSSSSLPAILSKECGNAAGLGMEGKRAEGRERIKQERMVSVGADRSPLYADTFS